ncbi:hypothetical protein Tco_1034838 [Tanacetum coccineum]
MGTIDSMKFVLTQSALDALCEKFHILDVVHPELPGRNDRIHNSLVGKIDVYSRFFDFANYRIPLSQFIVDILEYFQINLSQLSVIAAAKVSHFEILCRVHGFVPTVGNFRRFYINSKNKGWMSFSKRAENAPICYTRPLDSLKNWNDHFFWVDASAFPLAVPCHNDKTLRKYPHPMPAEFNADVCNYLADNPAPFRKFPEPFLCFVGISRYYDLDENSYPTFWANDDEEMDLFSFINHADPTKGASNDDVNEEGNDVAEADQTEQGDHVVHVGGIDIVADDEAQAIVADNLLDSSTLAVEMGATAAATISFVTSSVTPTSEREGGGLGDSVTGQNLRTQLAFERSSMPPPPVLTVVVTTTIIADVTSAPTPRAGTGQVPLSIFRDSASTGEANQDIAGPSYPIYIPKWNVTNDSTLDDFDVCRGVIDHLAPPALFSQLHSMDYEQLFAEFNVGTARQSCLRCEVRLRLKHELRVISESAEAIRLRGQVTVVKAAEAARASELNGLKERNVVLEGQVAALESAVVVKNTVLESSNAQIVKLTQDLSNLQLSCDELSIKVASLESNKDKLIDQVSQLESTCFGLREEVMSYKLFKEQIEAVQDISCLRSRL